MIAGVRYVHTNLVARDWRRLADFYIRLFGCELVPPERDFSGPELEAGTAVPGASLAGAHLRLPGFDESGPTLAFQVDSVRDARAEVLHAGGTPIGEVVVLTTATGGRVTWCYVADPEGNILELQSWQ